MNYFCVIFPLANVYRWKEQTRDGTRRDDCYSRYVVFHIILSVVRDRYVIFGDFNDGAVDLGGSLAVASRGLFATGVSTDLNGEYER